MNESSGTLIATELIIFFCCFTGFQDKKINTLVAQHFFGFIFYL